MTDPRRPDLRDNAASDDSEKRRCLNEWLRAAWIEGAEEDSLRRLGRGLTADEPRAGAGALSGGRVVRRWLASIALAGLVLPVTLLLAACQPAPVVDDLNRPLPPYESGPVTFSPAEPVPPP